ncbi:MAG: hypothetical protein BGP06_14860 [Rhizobiales bacterium 65-9]|nr:EthD family reductase [Hyphomicrobiales bacterium]OJY38277.1 MAG: hypothetical protein BGP06_14860 [Rhizobiales bacterium 65-9]
MIIRSAYLEGDVPESDRAEFGRRMTESVMPAIRTYPGIRDVTLRRIAERDEGAPPVYMIFDLYFDSLDDMRAALASETRQLVRAKIGEAMTLFRGRVYHLVFAQD